MHAHTHSSPAAGWEEEGRNSDHGPVGQVDEHDNEADRDAFLGKEERKRLDNMPPEKAKEELRCVCVCVCACACVCACVCVQYALVPGLHSVFLLAAQNLHSASMISLKSVKWLWQYAIAHIT